MKNPHIIDTLDYQGQRIILTYEKWKEKSVTHPELNNKKFLENLKRAIENPSDVWEDYDDKKRKICYYRKYSVNTYVKAVILIKVNPWVIISAFSVNKIKELKYSGLRQIV